MNAAELKRLEAQASQRRERFAATLSDFKEHVTLPNLGEEAARILGNVLPPASLIDAARQNPSVTLVLVAGIAWLVRQAKKVPARQGKAHAKRRKLPNKRSKENSHD
ncbi:hypothetical protein BH10PSE7_BH10PSE7_42690 [soil metagenome]